MERQEGLTRRDLILSAGKVVAGAAIITAGGLTLVSDAESSKGGKRPWPYTKLDPDEVAKWAYEDWYRHFCCHAVAASILSALQKKIGEPYTSIPLDAFQFGHGGVVGWGTICGTLLGAGIATGIIASHQGEKIANDVIAWYASTQLPIFKPDKPKAHIKNVSRSDSPLCHISVGRWMKKENVKFFSPPRKERCARLSADVARQTVILLNAWADGKYKPTHGSQAKTHQMPTMNNCTDCHGSNIPKLPGT